MPKSNSKKCKDYRERKKSGLKVIHIEAPAVLEPRIKKAAKEIIDSHESK